MASDNLDHAKETHEGINWGVARSRRRRMLPSGSHGHLRFAFARQSFGRIQQFAATLNASYLKSKLIAYFADFICVTGLGPKALA